MTCFCILSCMLMFSKQRKNVLAQPQRFSLILHVLNTLENNKLHILICDNMPVNSSATDSCPFSQLTSFTPFLTNCKRFLGLLGAGLLHYKRKTCKQHNYGATECHIFSVLEEAISIFVLCQATLKWPWNTHRNWIDTPICWFKSRYERKKMHFPARCPLLCTTLWENDLHWKNTQKLSNF